jgi:hypothetical protein
VFPEIPSVSANNNAPKFSPRQNEEAVGATRFSTSQYDQYAGQSWEGLALRAAEDLSSSIKCDIQKAANVELPS